MTAPTRYRSVFTGVQIDQLLSSISSKLDPSYIVNDFTGGVNQVASAETVKILNDELTQIQNPNYFLNLLENIPGFNVFTDAEKTKLDGLNIQFKGAYANATTRNLAVSTAELTGGELTFLLDDGSGFGLQSWDYWNASTATWTKAMLYRLGELTPVTFSVQGLAAFSMIDITQFTTCKVVLTATQAATTNIQVTELMLVTNGQDIFMTEMATIGNSTLIDMSADLQGTNMRLLASTLAPNVTIKGRKIVED